MILAEFRTAIERGMGETHVQWFLLALLLALVLWIAVHRWYLQWRRRRRWARARRAEIGAAAVLNDWGYIVVAAQVQSTYTMLVDGQPHQVTLRADYIVERNGLRYVAEVKSGKHAPRLDNPATRRQLLEYLMAYQAHGVLLVDGESCQVHDVAFPAMTQGLVRAPLARRWFLGLVLVVVALLMGWAIFS